MLRESSLLSDDVAERFALDAESFRSLALASARSRSGGEYSRATLRHAFSYPFDPLPFSFLIEGTRPWPLLPGFDSSRPSECKVLFEGAEKRIAEITDTPLRGERYPLLSYGANASVASLARKLSKLDGEDRIAPVVVGWLDGFGVGPSAHFSSYGAMPATLYEANGVRSKVAIAWVTEAQLNAIAKSEFNYLFGSVRASTFTPLDGGSSSSKGPLTFLSRHGVLRGDKGLPIPFAAVESEGCTINPLTQEAVLTYAASLTGSADATALVRRIATDYEWAVGAAYELANKYADQSLLQGEGFTRLI